MQNLLPEILIGIASFICSICGAMFVAGMRWGQVTGDIRNMSDRLAKIEGMFTLRLRDRDQDSGN
jgi:hypothetical protein